MNKANVNNIDLANLIETELILNISRFDDD